MTGPVEPSRPEDEPDSRGAVPPSEHPAATGWPGRPDAKRSPGSVTSAPTAPPAAPASTPSGSGWTSSAGGEPVRPAVPPGVPPRPSPLPPPRTTHSSVSEPDASVSGSLGAATVVPDRARRPAPRPGGRPAAARGRRAKLAVKRLDPWSVFVTSLVLSLLLGIVTIVAAFVLYAVLAGLGVPASINHNIGTITDSSNLVTRGKFVGIGALIAGANVVLLTALATIGSMLYNLVATFTGGVELTLAERD
ncbi:MAG: Transrane domain of unknown function [Frankiales bacterium]|nr:Transrane domain of unknown function [Frankiales bacterium]